MRIFVSSEQSSRRPLPSESEAIGRAGVTDATTRPERPYRAIYLGIGALRKLLTELSSLTSSGPNRLSQNPGSDFAFLACLL